MRVANKRAVSGWFVAVVLAAVTVALAPGAARSHGDVNPQPVDTKAVHVGDTGLDQLVRAQAEALDKAEWTGRGHATSPRSSSSRTMAGISSFG